MQDNVTFKSFGKSFQEKVLQALISDHSWAQQMIEVIKPSYFEQVNIKYLFEIYMNHWQKYKCFPTLQLLMTMAQDDLRASKDDTLCRSVVKYIKKIRLDPDVNDLPWVKDKSLNFCKNQALKEALEKAVDLIQEERHETIVDVIKKAITVGTPASTGHDFFEDLELRFVEEDRFSIPTGIDKLDGKDIMNGGLGRGEIGLIMAPTGVGKSHFLVQLGVNALKRGKNVLHYTFELRDRIVGRRYDSNFCDISSSDISNERDYVKNRYSEMKEDLGRLFIKEYPTNFASVITLRSHIEKLSITKKFVPDIILVDYADIMRSTRQFDSPRFELKLIYEELRALAMDFNVPIWTASQSNRDSANNDVVGLESISESFAKAMVCDVVLTLARKPMMKANGLGNLFVAKNRLGRDGILFPCKVDTACSKIELFDRETDMTKFEEGESGSMKQKLKDKWKEVKTDLSNDKLASLRVVGEKE